MSSHSFDQKPFDLLSELAKFGLERRMSIIDPDTISEFLTFAHGALNEAQADQALLHGQRVQAMFEAMLVSLGRFRLLKVEDSGLVHSDGSYAAPDFRIVLPDGEHWLIEVKNAYISDPLQQSRRFMTNGYREKLEKYALATGAELKLAVYWARWGIWTLVSPNRLVDSDGSVTLDMLTAIKINELGSLGDMMIGTKPPLRLRLATDPARVTPVADDGTVKFTIANVQVFCGEEELIDPIEREIAWIFMNYGDWGVTEPEAIKESL